MMVKISLKLMLFPNAHLPSSHWSDLLLPLYFLGALCAVTLITVPSGPAHLWIQSTSGLRGLQCFHPDSISRLVSLSVEQLDTEAPCLASYLLSFVLWFPLEAASRQGGRVLDLMQGILRRLGEDSVRREAGEEWMTLFWDLWLAKSHSVLKLS